MAKSYPQGLAACDACLHEELYFASGDFYLICDNCNRYWTMEETYTNNVGEACRLSGEQRVRINEEK